MNERSAEKDMSCAVCNQPIDAVRPPTLGRVFAHGSCLGRDVLIVEVHPAEMTEETNATPEV